MVNGFVVRIEVLEIGLKGHHLLGQFLLFSFQLFNQAAALIQHKGQAHG